MNLRTLHIRKAQAGGEYEIVQVGRLSRTASRYRQTEREWARQALYHAMGEPSADGSFDQTVGLPLARPFEYNRPQSVHTPACKIDRSAEGRRGGFQPSVNTLRPRASALPKRQASSLVTTYVPPRYHELFCAHDIFRGFACTSCQRSSREGREWLATVKV